MEVEGLSTKVKQSITNKLGTSFLINFVAVLILIQLNNEATAEVYDFDSEVHKNVRLCQPKDPFMFTKDIYLDRKYIESRYEKESVVNQILTLDLDYRKKALVRLSGHKSKNGVHRDINDQLKTYGYINFVKVAECLVQNLNDGDELYWFDNKSISPSVQRGYVILRDGIIIARAVLRERYVN
ncbi:hypothetical protein [Agarilytica rhodophyticola]|uniref:hypothetical protein n=1 Tax=Agarilytica rhodophyticola TaxID=1737490 RepID=UPI000B34965B|nr:hypothetical protein [Agarilytica rhodophyticola]